MYDESVRRAIKLVQSGQRAEARDLLRRILIEDRDNLLAWGAMVRAVERRRDKVFCLRQVLRLKPNDAWAIGYLERLGAPVEPLPPSTAESTGEAGSSRRVPPWLETLDQVSRRKQSAPTVGPPARLRAIEEAPPQSTEREEPAEAEPSLLGRLVLFSPWLITALLVMAVLCFFGYEFFLPHPQDREEVLDVAQAWTVAWARADSATMRDLICREYADEVSQSLAPVHQALGLGQLEAAPDNLSYEVVTLEARSARVRVSGPAGDSLLYVLSRERGQWTWCGLESP